MGQKRRILPLAALCVLVAGILFLINHAVLVRLAPFSLAMREAAERFVAEIDTGRLSGIAVMKIDDDTGHFLQDYLSEALTGKKAPAGGASLKVLGRSTLDKLPRPPTTDGFIKKLHSQHGVDAVINGAITSRKIIFGLASIRMNLTLNKLPGQEILHAESDLEGTAPLPVPLFLLYWLPFAILVIGVILIVRSLFHAGSSATSQGNVAQKPAGAGSADEKIPGTAHSHPVKINGVEKLTSLLREILAVNTDVMILSKQNNLNQAADFLADLGRFVQEEMSTVEKFDYTSADSANRLGLSEDDRRKLETLDESLAGLLHDLLAQLEQALQTLRAPVVDLRRMTTLLETLKVKSDTIRERFRERLELLEVE